MALKEGTRRTAPEATPDSPLAGRGFGRHVSGDKELARRVNNPPTRDSIRRMSTGAKIVAGIVVAFGVAAGLDATGVVDVPGIDLSGSATPADVDLTKCFTVPGTEARPLDVCPVIE